MLGKGHLPPNAQHATVAWAGWGMGLTIPAIILLLGKVAGLLWKRGQHRLLPHWQRGAESGCWSARRMA
jgi:hypothetical protein